MQKGTFYIKASLLFATSLLIISLLFAVSLTAASSGMPLPTCTSDWTGGTCIGSITYDTDTVLVADVNISGSVNVLNGVTLTTNGWSLLMAGDLNNQGAIRTGNCSVGGKSYNGGTYDTVGGAGACGLYAQAFDITAGAIDASGGNGYINPGYGQLQTAAGSGGGGAGVVILAYSRTYSAGAYSVNGGSAGMPYDGVCGGTSHRSGTGGSTVALGGAAGEDYPPDYIGGNGIASTLPPVTNAGIVAWYASNFKNFLSGAGGGYGAGWGTLTTGANSIPTSYGGSGGAGGGLTSCSTAGIGGRGGDGAAVAYRYTFQPLPTPQPYYYNAIVMQPSNTVYIGQGAVLTANVTGGGTPPYSYEWFVNGVQNTTFSPSNAFTFNPATPSTYSIYVVVLDQNGIASQSPSTIITATTQQAKGCTNSNKGGTISIVASNLRGNTIQITNQSAVRLTGSSDNVIINMPGGNCNIAVQVTGSSDSLNIYNGTITLTETGSYDTTTLHGTVLSTQTITGSADRISGAIVDGNKFTITGSSSLVESVQVLNLTSLQLTGSYANITMSMLTSRPMAISVTGSYNIFHITNGVVSLKITGSSNGFYYHGTTITSQSTVGSGNKISKY